MAFQAWLFSCGRNPDRSERPSRFIGARGRMKVFRRVVSAVLLLAGLSVTDAALADFPQVEEYKLKAAFLLNFAGFVQWPDGAFVSDSFIIGILGRDPFEGAADLLGGKTVKGRKVVIRRYKNAKDAGAANILFISSSEEKALPRILRSLRGRCVLTVGDSEGFARSGVMINMMVLRKRVGFDINRGAAGRAGLEISSHLLKLAREVIE
jgi:hypothetical protein